MEVSGDVVAVALAALVAILARDGARWLFRLISSIVAGTPTKLDDKIWEAVRGGLKSALEVSDGKQSRESTLRRLDAEQKERVNRARRIDSGG